MAHVPPGSRVLDLGCGGGLFLGLLAATRHGIRGYGADTSRLAIEVAQSMARTAKEDGSDAALEFAVLDVASQLPDGFFDVVALIDVAHHLPCDVVQSVLKAAAGRVRSDGGLLIYKDMSSEPFWQAAANRLHDLIVSRQWVSYYPIELVEPILRECGLAVVHAETLNRFWYRHELRVFRRDSPHALWQQTRFEEMQER